MMMLWLLIFTLAIMFSVSVVATVIKISLRLLLFDVSLLALLILIFSLLL